MSGSNLMKSTFRYKAWANDELLTALGSFDGVEHPDEHYSAIFILNHTYLVDRLFAGRLTGIAQEQAVITSKVNPSLVELSAAIKASDAWFVQYVSEVKPDELVEPIDFTFADGQPGRMSGEEMLTHLLMHGAFHRGAIGKIMGQLSLPTPRDVFTGYLHKAEASERRRIV
jgi:uncharacterized damage-inducible protein DinB